MSTEEDGVDESSRIMAPPRLEIDPDEKAADPIVDNSSMSSSRSRSGSSRSDTVRRAGNGNLSPADDAEAPVTDPLEGDAETAADKTESPFAEPISAAKVDTPVDNSAAKTDEVPVFVPPSGYPQAGWSTPQPRVSQPPVNGGTPMTNSNTAAGATATVPPAAAGLAGSAAPGWQQRGSADPGRKWPGARKQNKRQAMLTLARVEPWSVMKFSFVASVAAFIILWVAVALLYLVLSALGVFDSLQNTVSSVTSSESSAGTNISHWFSASLILGYTAMLGAFNIVIITAMCTVGSVIYNLIAKLFGGIEVTLRETD